MVAPEQWRVLLNATEKTRALRLQTCLLAMEFDVRLADASGRWTSEESDEEDGHAADAHPGDDARLQVLVRVEDWENLRGVMDEILAEQDEFDRRLELRRRRIVRYGLVTLAAGGAPVAWWVIHEVWR